MSTLGRYIRKVQDKEGLGNHIFTASFQFDDNPAVADVGYYVLPVDAMLVAACSSIKTDGTALSTNIGVDHTTGVGATTTVDLDADGIDIGFNDGPVASSDVLNGMIALEALAGDYYTVTVDAVATNAAGPLCVTLTFTTL